MIGWTLMGLGLLALLALLLTSGDILDRLSGSGDRRISRRAQLAAQRKRITTLEQQIADCPHCTPPDFPDDEQLAVADALAGPGLHVAAPADDPASWTHRTAEPAPADGEHLLTALVEQDPEATQALGVGALRAAAQMDAGDTATLPAVAPVAPVLESLPSFPPVTWGRTRDPETAEIEARLNIPGPNPLASATAIPVTAAANAVSNVKAIFSEAS